MPYRITAVFLDTVLAKKMPMAARWVRKQVLLRKRCLRSTHSKAHWQKCLTRTGCLGMQYWWSVSRQHPSNRTAYWSVRSSSTSIIDLTRWSHMGGVRPATLHSLISPVVEHVEWRPLKNKFKRPFIYYCPEFSATGLPKPRTILMQTLNRRTKIDRQLFL